MGNAFVVSRFPLPLKSSLTNWNRIIWYKSTRVITSSYEARVNDRLYCTRMPGSRYDTGTPRLDAPCWCNSEQPRTGEYTRGSLAKQGNRGNSTTKPSWPAAGTALFADRFPNGCGTTAMAALPPALNSICIVIEDAKVRLRIVSRD